MLLSTFQPARLLTTRILRATMSTATPDGAVIKFGPFDVSKQVSEERDKSEQLEATALPPLLIRAHPGLDGG